MLNFLIRLSGTDKELVEILPLLNVIVSDDETNIVNLILDEENVNHSSWFPRGVRVFNIPRNKQDGVFGVHHFAANLHDVFNVDYFFDFVNDFHSAFIGLAFKAKKRIGLSGGPKSYFYTHSRESFKGLFPDDKLLSVLDVVTEIDSNKTKFELVETKKEYLRCMIDIADPSDELTLSRIIEAVNVFDDLEKYFYIPSECEASEDVVKKLSSLGKVFSDPRSEIINKLDNFDITISASLFFSQLAYMKGCRSLVVVDSDFEELSCSRLDTSVMYLKFDQNDLVYYGIGELRELKVPSEIYDYILNFYSLRLEPSD